MMIFITCYIIVGTIWFLYKNHTHSVSDFYEEMSVEYKKNNQPMPHYSSLVVVAFILTITLWPVTFVTFVMAELNKMRGVK